MKIWISYFNNLRNFSENVLPLSTAQWDPKWFHENEKDYHIFIDKRHIVNGLRVPFLRLQRGTWEELVKSNEECCKDCPQMKDVPNCGFMKAYKKQLSRLNFNDVLSSIEQLQTIVNRDLKLSTNEVVLLVHEPPTRLCSERVVLQEWFKQHNVDLEEYPYKTKEEQK